VHDERAIERSPGAPETRLRGKRLLAAAALVAGAAALYLLANASLFDPSRLHVGGRFTDQAGYVTTARTWLDTGELRSGILFPALIREERWRLYMPGHYACLALSYAVLGFGVLASLLPSLLGYVLATTAVFVAGNACAGRRAGLLAAALFGLFPANVAYAFTAMAESTFTAACALALAALVAAPARLRPWLLPLLLVPPFLFKETGALYVIPLAVLVARSGRPLAALAATAASAALLAGVYAWQLADGKVSFLGGVGGRTFNYSDAFPPAAPARGLGAWLGSLAGAAGRNASELAEQWAQDPTQLSIVGLAVVLLAVLACLVRGVRARDGAALGAGALGLALAAMMLFVYDVKGQKAVRHFLFATPVLALGLGAWLASWRPASARGRVLALGAAALALAGAHLATRQAGRELVESDAEADAGTRLLEELGHDDSKLLMVWFDLAGSTLDYAVRHYPVPWSFTPANDATFAEIARRHELGTLILSASTLGGRPPPPRFHGGPLVLRPGFRLGGNDYVVYQSP